MPCSRLSSWVKNSMHFLRRPSSLALFLVSGENESTEQYYDSSICLRLVSFDVYRSAANNNKKREAYVCGTAVGSCVVRPLRPSMRDVISPHLVDGFQ